MSEPKITQEQVQKNVTEHIGALMLQLWQQEVYIKALDEFVASLPKEEAKKEGEVAS